MSDTGRNEWEALLSKMKMARVAHPLSEGEKVGIKWADAQLKECARLLSEESAASLALTAELRDIAAAAGIFRHPDEKGQVANAVAGLFERDETWRAKKAMLENDLGKAWERIEVLEKAILWVHAPFNVFAFDPGARDQFLAELDKLAAIRRKP